MTFEEMWRDLAPVGRSSLVGRLLPPALDVGRARAAVVVRRASARRAGWTVETDGIGNQVAWWEPSAGARPDDRASSPARTSTRSSTAGRTTARWASRPRSPRSTRCATRGFAPARPIGIGVFVEEEGSRFGRACLGSRLVTGATTWEQAQELRDRDGVFLADAIGAAGLDPCARTAGPRPRRHLRRAARRAGPRPRRPRRRRRAGQRDLAARAVALRLRRPGQPRRHHPDGGPARPDADLRDDGARREQAGPARRPARDLRPDRRSSPTAPTPSRHWSPRGSTRGPRPTRPSRRWWQTVERQAHDRAGRDGTSLDVTAESVSGSVVFDPDLAARLAGARRLAGHPDPGRPRRGHPVRRRHPDRDGLRAQPDRGLALARRARASTDDCLAGVDALADVLAELAGAPA